MQFWFQVQLSVSLTSLILRCYWTFSLTSCQASSFPCLIMLSLQLDCRAPKKQALISMDKIMFAAGATWVTGRKCEWQYPSFQQKNLQAVFWDSIKPLKYCLWCIICGEEKKKKTTNFLSWETLPVKQQYSPGKRPCPESRAENKQGVVTYIHQITVCFCSVSVSGLFFFFCFSLHVVARCWTVSGSGAMILITLPHRLLFKLTF